MVAFRFHTWLTSSWLVPVCFLHPGRFVSWVGSAHTHCASCYFFVGAWSSLFLGFPFLSVLFGCAVGFAFLLAAQLFFVFPPVSLIELKVAQRYEKLIWCVSAARASLLLPKFLLTPFCSPPCFPRGGASARSWFVVPVRCALCHFGPSSFLFLCSSGSGPPPQCYHYRTDFSGAPACVWFGRCGSTHAHCYL